MNLGITGSIGVLGSVLKKKLRIKNKNLFNGKIENKKNVNNWIKTNNFDIIIHLAAIVPIKIVNQNKQKALIVNFEGTKNLVDAVNKYSKKKVWFFFTSTSHVYPFKSTVTNELSRTKPLNYYGKTKLLSEKYILGNTKKLLPCIGRIFSFTSHKQNNFFIVPKLISKLRSSKKQIFIENINHIRDFVTVDDICRAIKILMKKKSKGIYNICSGNKINLKEILFTLNKKYKKKIILKDNKNKTILFGSNAKLIKKGWKISNKNYLNYLKNNF